MSNVKRCISLLLVLVLMCSMIPVPGADAAEQTAEVDTGAVSVQGTNGFGNLVSAAVAREQAEQEDYEAGYSVTDLEMEGNVATVSYETLEEAILMVVLYTEDGMQMLISGKTSVTPEETEVQVTIEGTMPEYFRAAAYLVDKYDFSPLCQSYDTPMYTREMQELLASTVDDYDEEKVLNLDEDKNTNFAVYADSTRIIEPAEGQNIVFSVDEEKASYVIKNADEQFTSLKKGDVVAYSYGENELLIVKVKSISVNGTTVTITGDELELQDVFAAVKIESIGTTEDLVVDESTLGEGVTYVGLTDAEEPNGVRPANEDVSVKQSKSMDFSVNTTLGGTSGGSGEATLIASLKLDYAITFECYTTFTYVYLEFRLEQTTKCSISLTGKVEDSIRLGYCFYAPIPGVITIEYEPELVFSASAKLEWACTFTNTVGFCFDNRDGYIPLNSKAETTSDLSLSGTFFVGVDPHVDIKFIGSIFSCEFHAKIGIEAIVKDSGNKSADFNGQAESRHDCAHCLDIELFFKLDPFIKLKILEVGAFSVVEEIHPKTWRIGMGHSYYSIDLNQIGEGTCPNIYYMMMVTVKKSSGYPLADADILVNGTRKAETNRNGVAQLEIRAGRYDITAVGGGAMQKVTVEIPKQISAVIRMPVSVSTDTPTTPDKDQDTALDKMPPEEAEDRDAIVSSGICGDDLKWDLYESGRLEIYGTGDMYDYRHGNRGPWGSDKVKTAVIGEGVTSIGNYAFYWCPDLVSVTLPDSLTRIGDVAFVYARKLEEITFGKNFGYLGNEVFYLNAFLENLKFTGDCPEFHSNAFRDVIAVAAYPADNPTWTEDKLQNYGGLITWVAYGGNSGDTEDGGEDVKDPPNMTEKASVSEQQPGFEIPGRNLGKEKTGVSLNAVYGGEYGTEITQDHTVKTASFAGLIPGGEYLLLSMKSMDAEDPLASENLLFVDQAAAGEDGTLKFTYIQREHANISYVVACGPSGRNLQDAQITFPEMTADGELQAAEPVVVYEGETLVEGEDYILTGTVSFREAGEYTCFVRGIRNYTGSVECTYQVMEGTAQVLGDLDLDGDVDSDDLTLLARHVGGIELASGQALTNADVNGDGNVDSDDLTMHARYVGGIITEWFGS